MTSSDNLVLFSHGMMSRPSGTKIQRLSVIAHAKGFRTEALDYSSTYDPDERVEMLLKHNPQPTGQLILVGSSMGSYVATVASKQLQPTGLFLLAPAFYLAGYQQSELTPYAQKTSIVHGWNDEIIPFDHSVQFGQAHQADVHLLPGDHRLMDVLPQIEHLFSLYLDSIQTLS